MLHAIAESSSHCSSVQQVDHVERSARQVCTDYAIRFEPRVLNRLLGRCGRVSDTADPSRYARVLRHLQERFGSRFRYGFMVPANLFIEGVVRHPTYHQPRIPQMAPLVVFRRQDNHWSATTVLWVQSSSADGARVTLMEKLVALYENFGVEMLFLRPGEIDEGALDTLAFHRRLKRAIYSPCFDTARSAPQHALVS